MENYFTKTNTLNYYILNESITKPQFFLSFFSSIYLIYVYYPSVKHLYAIDIYVFVNVLTYYFL